MFSLPPPAGLHCTHCTCAYYVSNDRGTADILAACGEAQPPLMTRLTVLRARAPHPPNPTPNTQTLMKNHQHNYKPPCASAGRGEEVRHILPSCVHTHTDTQLGLSRCGFRVVRASDKHGHMRRTRKRAIRHPHAVKAQSSHRFPVFSSALRKHHPAPQVGRRRNR